MAQIILEVHSLEKWWIWTSTRIISYRRVQSFVYVWRWRRQPHHRQPLHEHIFHSIVRQIINIFYFLFQLSDIEAQIQEIQNKKKELAQTSSDKGVGLLESGYFDSELYDDGTNKKSRYEGYMTSIAANDDIDEDDDEGLPIQPKRISYTAPKAVLKDIIKQVCTQIHHISLSIN